MVSLADTASMNGVGPDPERLVEIDGHIVLVFKDRMASPPHRIRWQAWVKMGPEEKLEETPGPWMARAGQTGWWRTPLPQNARRAIKEAFPEAEGVWEDYALWAPAG